MKVYDCILFNDENTILEIRINELNDYVDYFVIIESKFTHQNKIKKQKINKKLLEKFKKKIKYSFLDIDFNNFKPWEIENFQRNAILDHLKLCHPSDIILISDADEIPNLKKINFSEVKNQIFAFNQIHTMYKLNLLREKNWIGTKLCKYKNLKSPQWLRNLKVHKKYPFYRIDKIFFSSNYYKNFKIIEDGGWHFGWIKNADEIIEKINNFAHTEFLSTHINDTDYIKNCIKNNIDFFNKQQMQKIDTNMLPDYILSNISNYKSLLL